MQKLHRSILFLLAMTAVILLLSACSTATDSAGEADGQEAFVDDVTIKEQMEHSYATVLGHYPNSCSRVSDVQQSVEGSSITIMLYVAQPADMMCAQMLTPFSVDILLETGGLAPGEYTVTVNEVRSTTFAIGG